MESVSKQEYMRVLSELDMLTNKFVALEQENQRLLGDLQHVSTEKAQQYEELSQRVRQLEATILSLREQAVGGTKLHQRTVGIQSLQMGPGYKNRRSQNGRARMKELEPGKNRKSSG